ncbi:MAG: UvrD-helicase domain-containing protein [Anaerolineales bacterium]|nr:UvrD-helicase domain-containing protein [Anaerolineales bacterium]
MTTAEHPERPAETAHLAETLAILEARIAEVGSYKVQGFTTHDTAALHRKLVEMHLALKSARQQVFFGRLDFVPDGAPAAETHYLGKVGFDRNSRLIVLDWRAPVGRLFSRRRPGPGQYASPDGRLSVTLRLKRHFNIEQQSLLSLHDEFDTRPEAWPAGAERPGLIDPDAYLREILSGRGAAHMLDIVASLQEHQDDLIRAEPQQALVVQGAAGSGKTSVALHRVAYLLYPPNKTGIDASRCIIFGPNRLFLGYIANVLPGLGVAGIDQRTLEAWALERLGLAERPLVDTTQAALLGAASLRERQAHARRSQLKASLRFGRVLEGFVNAWRARLVVPAQGMLFDKLGPLRVSVEAPRAHVLEIHHSLSELPLLRQRQRFIELLLVDLMGAYAAAVQRHLAHLAAEGDELQARQHALRGEADRLADYARYAREHGDGDLDDSQAAAGLEQGAAALRALAEHFDRKGKRLVLRAARLKDEDAARVDRPQVRAELQRRLEAELERGWPPLDPLAGFHQLLADLPQLARAGRGLLSSDELELLHRPTPPDPGAPIDASDLPALCYLHLLLNGVLAPLFDHVVVDEAQDVAPLYYAVLRRLSRNGSFTVLGDLAQSVFAYRGLAEWDDLRPVFSGLPCTFVEMADSYRSTYEIITFSNRILELLAPDGQAPRLARPFERHGAPVQLHRLDAPAELVPALAEAARELQQQGFENIALIAKTAEQAAALANHWPPGSAGPLLVATTAEQTYAGGLVVIPVHLAKGMEFEAVLLVDAGAGNYAASEFDGRLLYVAATRALHVLHLFSIGAVNAYVELAHGA